ncbi:DUF695 domain-containing protein [Pontibacter sp. BT310]|uniref:DUF695 domain-containing protein n=1 Tax=Pontibacter populi TaxID=890055 RepID=A0ABS6XAE0_9BACT|nr:MULTISPECIES: DUF695 domain-containing protein [Pontibacter]MBJ6118107.1 DUF695 domain-containing protein [Pontibacter sp. BT310]MBR0570534.1 DUF695 domain-containing protein [Microvirga sp. STS03]MBW3364960.1 DUF695 domain-containing protein [Pontibacter populi]
MKLLRSMLQKEDKPVRSYEEFWAWFQKNERAFYQVVKNEGNLERDFFDKLSPKLADLKDGFFFLTGMYDDNTAELVLTADGTVRNFVFVEELVDAAPQIGNWRITAHKPAMPSEDFGINMQGYTFSAETLHFYPNLNPNYPDEIDITIVYDDFNEENKAAITNGVYIFLDNYLGELESATIIDNIVIAAKVEVQEELIPIAKLQAYLGWRQKEFVEKYEGVRHDTENDNHSMLEAELESGNTLLAVINTDLLEWDGKASHPWIMTVEIPYDGESNNGMPDDEIYKLLNEVEDEILAKLKDVDGYLNIGRQTADSMREIYFACKDFRKPSKVMHNIQMKYADQIEISFDLYKDKYWMSFNRFMN